MSESRSRRSAAEKARSQISPIGSGPCTESWWPSRVWLERRRAGLSRRRRLCVHASCPVFDSSMRSYRKSKTKRKGVKLRPAHVSAGASVDLDCLAFFDEERNVDCFSSLKFGRLGHIAGGIAAQSFS